MKKFKLLRHGQCYINREGDFVIALVSGCKRKGYQFVGSYLNKFFYIHRFQLMSRIVPNDGHWIEVDPDLYRVAAAFHWNGYVIKMPATRNLNDLPVITKAL